MKALPPSYKVGALALGATHWQAIWRVMIPAARSGIVASIILGMGRAIGETMAMIMILGNAVKIPTSFLDSARTLTTNIGIEMGYASGDHRQALFATGVILFFIIMILNSLAISFHEGESVDDQSHPISDSEHGKGSHLDGRYLDHRSHDPHPLSDSQGRSS